MPICDYREWTRNYLEPLVGATIVEVDALIDERCSPFEAWPILVIQLRNGKKQMVTVSRDAEENGPGWLEVSDIEEAATDGGEPR